MNDLLLWAIFLAVELAGVLVFIGWMRDKGVPIEARSNPRLVFRIVHREDRAAYHRMMRRTVAVGVRMCAGFAANGPAHHVENRTDADVVVLEVGDRTPGDQGSYPSDDLRAKMGPDGKWQFAHKDGTPY